MNTPKSLNLIATQKNKSHRIKLGNKIKPFF